MNRDANPVRPVNFDEFAGNYDSALDQGISLSGEGKDFFARGRVEWLQRCMQGARAERVLDYGCGTGMGSGLLQNILGARSVLGVDISTEAIAIAQGNASESVSFCPIADYRPAADFDLAFCNGVFHHVPLGERSAAVGYIRDSLRPGGLFSFWENNPWNPGTRIVMRRIPFDRDAILVSALEARRMLREGGFDVLSVNFRFIFPKMLSALRALETPLSRLPLGAQYQVLCRKPS